MKVGGLPVKMAPSVFGWITILQKSSQDNTFNVDWSSYKYGFGSIDSYFWLGLERVYQLSNASGTPYRLRVEFQFNLDWKWQWFSAEYGTFGVASEDFFYGITVEE